MVARRHHYLPRCYLKHFGKPRGRGASHHVYVADRDGKAFTANIINVATEKDFNRIDVEGHPPDAIEQGYAKFEGELGPALLRILESRSLNNDDDRLLLMNLIGITAIRNPRRRENIRGFHERTAEIIMDLATSTKERWEGQMRRMKASGYVPEHDVPYEELRRFVVEKAFRLEVSTERHIQLELHSLDAVLRTLLDRKWVVLLAPKETGGFITCDHPVCLMFSDPKRRGGFHGPGHGLPGTEVIFPISRRMAVVGAFEIKEDTIVLDASGVARLNGAMVAYADRQVYAADTNFLYTLDDRKPRLGASLVKDAQFLKK
ncbi:DUF4238 domain-containing protein [Bradyrhizobium sp. LMTR 3]|uniref:DUF4238 domain-containing protein n=1 Tax=Bradyrhizobium sp. LMTR 3 TaxID=189873 RepID=UPI0008106E17|nr:DUF4238 domain-containing protein [Bradyrhizobium sp. LMTR 3]OCK56763.1 hypothetical protein LMTR3_14100 [Bradyrhizobium sp. LMTR 3]